MIIYNTTFHVHPAKEDEFISWIKEYFIPKAIDNNTLTEPQLALIMARQEGDEGNSYSLQFKVESIDILNSWYKGDGTPLINEIGAKFGQHIAGFTTIMNVVEL
ncbi:MAG: DUF4286 family protein [Muribaculaceae bacterium]|nr:DUF4286 family protein [Muribaculaceae bacterium]